MPNEVLFNEEEALQKATILFWLKGYNGTSMDELTKATGLSRSSIYNSFGTKHNLFIKCLNYYKQNQYAHITLSLHKANTPLKKIQLIFRIAIDDLIKDKDNKGCLIINTTAELANLENKIAVFVKKNMEDFENLFQQLIKDGQQIGEINKTLSPLAAARHLYNCLVGLKIIAQITNDKRTLEDIAKVSLSVLQK
jgi:TetR/AcrR family transcriptional regulator, transcriptional repressor for nem operon